MNRPHTFSPASSLSYSNQVGSRQVTQPLRCVEGPAGPGGQPFGGSGSQGPGLGTGGRGPVLRPVQIWQGCPASCSGPARGCAHPWRLALPSPLASHLFWCGSRAAHLHPGLFCPSEWKKENSTTKNPLCQPQIPIESTRQKGGKEQEEPGRSFHKQRFLQMPADPARCVQGMSHCSGGSF